MSVFTLSTMRLLGAGHVSPDATWRFAAHDHPYWEFIYFLHGCGSVNLPHTMLRPHFSHLLIFPPGLSHAENTDPIDPEETLFFSIDVSGALPIHAPLLLPDRRGDFRWLCERIYEECQQKHRPTQLGNTYAQALLLTIERAWDEHPQKHDPIAMVQQYLMANYTRAISLDMLAAIAHISPNHLTHRFTRHLGISPLRYLKSLRIDAARHLLITTDLTVKDIAIRVGFTDHLYFRRVFKEMTSMTPSQIRQFPTDIHEKKKTLFYP